MPVLSRSLPVLALIAGIAPASAQTLGDGTSIGYLPTGYAAAYGGYGSGLVDGAYVGAPFTRVPSPREIVPTPWGYGTYGVPTVSGIRRAPVGEPVVYVIEGTGKGKTRRESERRRQAGRWSGLTAAEPVPQQAGGARVIEVRVPRR